MDLLNQTTGKIRDDIVLALDHRFQVADEKLERRLAEEGAKLREEIGKVREEIGNVREEIGNVRKEVAGLKGELVAWTFLFWLGTIGILFAFFRP